MEGWVSNEAELSLYLRGRRCVGGHFKSILGLLFTFPLRLVFFKVKVADQYK